MVSASRLHLRRWLVAATLLLATPVFAEFDVSHHRIPVDEIVGGGPPKDGIPAILAPQFIAANAATFPKPQDAVVGVVWKGVARAYPISILNWHEVVNDDIDGKKIAVTYCPLTGSAIVFDRKVNGRELSFGVSGKLYQSNVLLYDHQTESLWSQLAEEAVTGDLAGSQLQALPSSVTSWADWSARYPRTVVLSFETGHVRNYARDPYESYHGSPTAMFPPSHEDGRLPAKEKVFGVQVAGAAKAYRLKDLAAISEVVDEVGGERVRIDYVGPTGAVSAGIEGRRAIAGVVAYWFAWSAFHRDTAVWDGEAKGL